MRKQLWFRLLLGSSFILMVALAAAGVVLHRSATVSFQEYVEDVSASRSQRIEALLSRYYSRRQDWAGVEPLVQQIADLVGQQVILANSTDVVIVDSQNQLVGQRVKDAWKHLVVPIRAGDVAVGTLYVDPIHAPSKLGPRGDAFVSELSTSLLSALGVGMLAALAVSLLVARRLAAPLEALTVAVRRLEAGERSAHIEISRDGEVGALAEAFNSLVDSLARVEQLRSNMVNDIAHELRTPLTTIRGYVEAIQDGVAEPNPDVLDTVHGELLQLSRLVDDLRDLALAEAGQLHLAPEPTSVDALITHDVRALAVACVEQDITIRTSVPEDIPILLIDAGRISQALRNLLNNAMAHTPRGGTISVSAAYDGQYVSIAVQDSGSGIPPEDLPHVFERFYRGDRSRSRRAGGAGLGLSISREILAAHHGALVAESPPGQGARFTLRLPLAPAVSKPAKGRLEHRPARPAGATSRILGVLRLGFYALMSGGLAGMIAGAAESVLIAVMSRRAVDVLGLASYAIVIDAIAVGLICAVIAVFLGIVALLLGHAPRVRDIASVIGPTAIIAVGSILTLKWTQLTTRDATIANPVGGQLLIVGSTLLLAVIAFAALSTTAHWPHRTVDRSRRAIPAVAVALGLVAIVGIVRDLADRGVEAPVAFLRTVHDYTIGPLLQRDSAALSVAPSAPLLTPLGARPNVLLVTVDALRADHLGSYGYQAAETPTLDSLARDGWKVELAVSPRPSSAAAHASILTGVTPDRHGVRTDLLDTVAHGVPTIAETLQANGYTTAGLYSWFSFEPAYSGLDRGFQTYEDYTINLPRYLADTQTQALAATVRRLKSYLAIPAAADLEISDPGDLEEQLDGKADVTAAAAIRWLERRRTDPFFLWVHFRDPRAPYASQSRTEPLCDGCPDGSLETLHRLRDGAIDLSAPEINHIVRSYDDEVGFVDRQLDGILRQLSQLGLDSNTVVIVAGAFGQSFGDHGAWLEGSTVYNSEIHVPVLIRYPNVLPAGRVITEPASLLDVVPTILHLTGIASPSEIDGRSLIALSESPPSLDRTVLSESAENGYIALIAGEWKLIRAPDGQVELYNMSADPDEHLDRSESEPDLVRHLVERLEELTGRS